MNETGRKSSEQRGVVHFPTESPAYKNTGEGGMFVYLVVDEVSENWEDRFQICCGTYAYMMLGEVFVGDDVHAPAEDPLLEPPEGISEDALAERIENYNHHSFGAAGNFHFPGVYPKKEDREPKPDPTAPDYKWQLIREYQDENMSVGYLATICLGSTGWSGWNEAEERYWKCTLDDLSEEGKQLYHLVEKLYGHRGKLYIQTWLDT